ncbi:MAG: hypothetical protein AAF236_13690 [Verrucomicrobiota bacterium]
MEVGHQNPFTDDIFIDHPDNLPGVARIHHRSFQRIVSSIEKLVGGASRLSPAEFVGRTLLVTAPRAGYGKSHLSARLRQHLKSTAVTLDLSFDRSSPITWTTLLRASLRESCHDPGTSEGARSRFQEVGRYFLAEMVLDYLRNQPGADPCPVTESQLKSEYALLFSPDSPTGALDWVEKQIPDLCHAANSTFLRRLGLTRSELEYWVSVMIDSQRRGDRPLESLRGLPNGEARERFLQWLRLCALYRPVLLIADDLDGFFNSDSAGMEIAALLTGIREAVPRSLTLLCLNREVWDATFENRLPTAWIDRLMGETEKLRGISPEAAGDLVRMRLERIDAPPTVADRLVQRLSNDHLWIDPEAKLSPRAVLRQASELWSREGARFLKEAKASEVVSSSPLEESPLKDITDKIAFFTALQSDCDGKTSEADLPAAESAPAPQPETEPPHSAPEPTTPVIPFPEPVGQKTDPVPENPFFAPPPPREKKETPFIPLTGIESIIRDIRGSGNKVASESSSVTPSQRPKTNGFAEIANGESIQFGDLSLKSGDAKTSSGASTPQSTTTSAPPAILNQVVINEMIDNAEKEILADRPLKLDLARLEAFFTRIGAEHGGLNQSSTRLPGGQTASLRWNVRGQSILVSFESPKNVYFWNHLLQQSLASDRTEKLAAFSHASEPFDPTLFASFGFSPTVTRGRIDIIEMTDSDLALLYAADQVLAEVAQAPESPYATQIISRRLDPLWRRVSERI